MVKDKQCIVFLIGTLAPILIDSMTNDARNTFARRGMPIHVAHRDGLVQCHPDRSVAAYAEVAECAVVGLNQPVRHRVKDGAHLCISMSRNRPFAIMPRMAGLTLLGRRERVAVKACRMCMIRRERNCFVLLMSLRVIVADANADSTRGNVLLIGGRANMVVARRMDVSLHRAIDLL